MRNVGAGSFSVNSHCHVTAKPKSDRSAYSEENLRFLEEVSLTSLLKEDFAFIRQYPEANREKVLTVLLDDLHRVVDGVKSCIYDPNRINKSHHLCQWVSEVKAVTSEYQPGVGCWGAANLIGTPKTFPRYGDINTAWAPLTSSGSEESLHVKFATPVYVCGVDIFETWNPGYIVKVSAFDGSQWQVLWKGSVEQRLPELPRVFSPPFSCTTYRSDQIRIDLDCTNSVSWTEIDAIRLRGRETYDWTPQTHCRYPLPFRETVYSVLLCVNRLVDQEKITITQDVLFLIFKFLARSYIQC
jgi:hypothetical protein